VNEGERWQPFVKAKAPRAPQPPDVVLWTITARNITSAELRFQGQDGYLPFEIGIVREGDFFACHHGTAKQKPGLAFGSKGVNSDD
jgi:hypothetical protein